MPASMLRNVLPLPEAEFLQAVRKLVSADALHLNFGQNFVNTAVRAWDLGSAAEQLKILDDATGQHFVVYPGPAHLKKAASRRFKGQPFSRELAYGRGQLEPIFFDVSVLEFYRNDPRYHYRCNSVSGYISVRDKFYSSDDMKESDKVLLQTFGFGFDDDMNRYVAAYLIYLSRLSPEHQTIWNAKRVSIPCKLHPDYYMSTIRGFWAEKTIVFDAFRRELYHINRICERLQWPPLFKDIYDEDVPRDFCFLIRPTLREFEAFVHLLDKMLSDNINPNFFAGVIPLEHEETRKDGKVVVTKKGTLTLLSDWLLHVGSGNPEVPAHVKRIVEPFREVRKMRQHPAHNVNPDVFDQSFLKQQRELMVKVYESLGALRMVFHDHPQLGDYELDDHLRDGKIRTF